MNSTPLPLIHSQSSLSLLRLSSSLPLFTSLRHLFYSQFINSKGATIYLIEHPLNLTTERYELIRLLFDYFLVKSVASFPLQLAQLVGAGIENGIIVDIGHHFTTITACFNFCVLLYSMKTWEVGLGDLIELVVESNQCDEHIIIAPSRLSREKNKKVLERLMQQNDDGNTIVNSIVDCVEKCSVDIKSRVVKDIVLTVHIPGLQEMLEEKLRMVKKSWFRNVHFTLMPRRNRPLEIIGSEKLIEEAVQGSLLIENTDFVPNWLTSTFNDCAISAPH